MVCQWALPSLECVESGCWVALPNCFAYGVGISRDEEMTCVYIYNADYNEDIYIPFIHFRTFISHRPSTHPSPASLRCLVNVRVLQVCSQHIRLLPKFLQQHP